MKKFFKMGILAMALAFTAPMMATAAEVEYKVLVLKVQDDVVTASEAGKNSWNIIPIILERYTKDGWRILSSGDQVMILEREKK
ncbi:MAG: hypothetical protein M0036_19015 [Desulfobacteraceae bacterium]|nr:hypothetical protein [Desulfobacteraceae bacterium]